MIKNKMDSIQNIQAQFPDKVLTAPHGSITYIEASAWKQATQEDRDNIRDCTEISHMVVDDGFCTIAATREYPLTDLGNALCLLACRPEAVIPYHFFENGEVWKSAFNEKGGGRLVCDYSLAKGINRGMLQRDCFAFAQYLTKLCDACLCPIKESNEINKHDIQWAKSTQRAINKRRDFFASNRAAKKISSALLFFRDEILQYIDQEAIDTIQKEMSPEEFAEYLTTINKRKVWGHLVNCQNGVLNLHTGELRPFTVLDMCSQQVNADYIPGAECPEGLQFVADLMNHNQDRLLLLQMVLGAALSGALCEHVKSIPLFYGPLGYNGKSTLLMALFIVFGWALDLEHPGYVHLAENSMLLPSKRTTTPELYACTSSAARFVAITGPASAQRIDPEKFKRITCQTSLAVRGKYKDTTVGEWLGTLLMECNAFPVIDPFVCKSGLLPIIPFEVSFLNDDDPEAERRRNMGFPVMSRRDDLTQLFNSNEFKNWFLQWVFEGYNKWVANGRKFHSWPTQAAEEVHIQEQIRYIQ